MILDRVTLTGADCVHDVPAMAALANDYPQVEFALLLTTSQTRQGTPRYPKFYDLITLYNKLYARGVTVAVHACGAVAADILDCSRLGNFMLSQFNTSSRIQLNLSSAKNLAKKLTIFHEMHPRVRLILQHNSETESELAKLADCNWFDILRDASGGRGIHEPWQRPGFNPRSLYGYAGGIGVDNIAECLASLTSMLPKDEHTWIDMESSLRETRSGYMDRMDFVKCVRILEACQNWTLWNTETSNHA